jgi:hypothetical protein
MSCQHATEKLSDAIKDVATRAGEQWTKDLVVKTVFANRMRYWDPADEEKFHADYEFIAAARATPGVCMH